MRTPDPLYVAARRVLLDALLALQPHAHAFVVVGAHAVYLRTGDAGIPIAPFTTDADLAVDPALLAEQPELERLLVDAGFTRDNQQPGAWTATTTVDGQDITVPVDLMVPTAVAPPGGSRSVRLPGHDKMATRRAAGLEAALIDNDVQHLRALDPADTRAVSVRVAGATALIIAKLHKLHDRLGDANRLSDKDASDVFRLMQATETSAFLNTIHFLLTQVSATESTRRGLAYLQELFGARLRDGVKMAVASLDGAVTPEQVEAICLGFVRDVRAADV